MIADSIKNHDLSELCKNDTQLKEYYNNIIKSYVSYSQQLLLLFKSEKLKKELCNSNIHLFSKYYIKWIEIIHKEKYLKIVFFLISNGICYVNGLRKIFGGETSNLSKDLDRLQQWGIIKVVKNKNIDVHELYTHKEVFRIDDWHFNKTIFYELTDMAKKILF